MLFFGIILTRICLHGVTTGSPSSKYEHCWTSALLRNIRNIRICIGKKMLMFADVYISSLGYLWCHPSCQTLQEPNFACLSLKSTVLLFALDSAHVKLDIWNSPIGHYWAKFGSQRGTRHSVVHQWETYEAENNSKPCLTTQVFSLV